MAKIDELENELEDLKKQFYYFVKNTDLQQVVEETKKIQTVLTTMQNSVQRLSSEINNFSNALLTEVDEKIENQ